MDAVNFRKKAKRLAISNLSKYILYIAQSTLVSQIFSLQVLVVAGGCNDEYCRSLPYTETLLLGERSWKDAGYSGRLPRAIHSMPFASLSLNNKIYIIGEQSS